MNPSRGVSSRVPNLVSGSSATRMSSWRNLNLACWASSSSSGCTMPDTVRTFQLLKCCAISLSKLVLLMRAAVEIYGSTSPTARPSRSSAGAYRTTGHTPKPCSRYSMYSALLPSASMPRYQTYWSSYRRIDQDWWPPTVLVDSARNAYNGHSSSVSSPYQAIIRLGLTPRMTAPESPGSTVTNACP